MLPKINSLGMLVSLEISRESSSLLQIWEEFFRETVRLIIHANSMFVRVNYFRTEHIDSPAVIQSPSKLQR